MSYQFENSDASIGSKSSLEDSSYQASQALLADSMTNPFKATAKDDVAPIIVASNEQGCQSNDRGCGTPDVPPVEDHDDVPTPVETPVQPIENHNNQNNEQSQQQQMEQSQRQQMEQEQRQQQALDNRNDIYSKNANDNANVNDNANNIANKVDVNSPNSLANRVDVNSPNSLANRVDVNSPNSLANKVDASSANSVDTKNAVNVRTGDNVYKSTSYSNARAEALPGNECQSFAARADGHFLGTGGGLGLSVSDDACLKAKAEKVKCDAPASLGIANEHNSAAEQSWLKVANSAQQQQIIEHGIRNTQKISDSAAQKSAECASVGVEKSEVVQEKVVVQQPNIDTSEFATKRDLKQQSQEFNSKLDVVHKHNMQK